MNQTNDGPFFCRNRTQNTMYTAMVVLGIAGFILGLITGTATASLGLVMVFGIIMLATKDKPVLEFHDTFLKFKPTPLAPLTMIAYQDIGDVSVTGKKMSIAVKNRPKPITWTMSFFNKEDHEEIEKILSRIASANKTKQ